jgi:hypothetical protein
MDRIRVLLQKSNTLISFFIGGCRVQLLQAELCDGKESAGKKFGKLTIAAIFAKHEQQFCIHRFLLLLLF